MTNIDVKKSQLIDMINNNHDLEIILIELKKYVLLVMERDIPSISIQTRNEVSIYVIYYFIEAIRNGYITSDNKKICLERALDTLSHFFIVDNALTYGECHPSYDIGFNFNSSFFISNMKHVIFHELTHCLANLFNQELGKKGIIIHKEGAFKVTDRSDNVIPIISPDMITFLNEIMAESTACDLAKNNKKIKTQVIPGVLSDWLVFFNRSYQDLGFDFLRTLSYDTNLNEQDTFKKFTLKAINNNNQVCSEIMKIYEEKNPYTWKEDLDRITTLLGDIARTHILEDSKVEEVRELMKKYYPNKTFRTISRTDLVDDQQSTFH